MKMLPATALALVLATTGANAQPYSPCSPERAIDALAAAFVRIAPMFMRPPGRVPPETTGAAPHAPPAKTAEGREAWRQRLFDEMRNYCSQWPTDKACGPNARGEVK